MKNYYRDEKGRWLGKYLLCMKWGHSHNLRRLPLDKLNREYCIHCFYGPLKHDIEMKQRYQEMK